MSYIGATPVIGNFQKCDAITTSATDTFNLLVGGAAVSPATANNCIVSLNGVIQAPGASGGFTISGSTIVFNSALTSADVIDFILLLGNVLDIGTPSDSTVSLAKLTATGSASASTFLRGDNSWGTPSGGKILQVVSVIKADVFSSSVGTTWTDITDLTVTTGALATTSSRVLVCANLSFFGVDYNGFKIVDGAGADITDFIGDAASSRIRSTSGNMYAPNDFETNFASPMLIDSPASTSAQTYKVQGYSSSANAFGVNRSKTDADNGNHFRGVSSMTAWEIGA